MADFITSIRETNRHAVNKIDGATAAKIIAENADMTLLRQIRDANPDAADTYLEYLILQKRSTVSVSDPVLVFRRCMLICRTGCESAHSTCATLRCGRIRGTRERGSAERI